MPKIYCAFSKDTEAISHYCPHFVGNRALLSYRAQPIENFPLAQYLGCILQRFNFTDWNFVTVVMYNGANSGISEHRDRWQIEGYDDGTEQIASFVLGESR